MEISDGQERHLRARFQTFDSPADSVTYHGALLSQDDRYGAAQVHRSSWRGFLDALAPLIGEPSRIGVTQRQRDGLGKESSRLVSAEQIQT